MSWSAWSLSPREPVEWSTFNSRERKESWKTRFTTWDKAMVKESNGWTRKFHWDGPLLRWCVHGTLFHVQSWPQDFLNFTQWGVSLPPSITNQGSSANSVSNQNHCRIQVPRLAPDGQINQIFSQAEKKTGQGWKSRPCRCHSWRSPSCQKPQKLWRQTVLCQIWSTKGAWTCRPWPADIHLHLTNKLHPCRESWYFHHQWLVAFLVCLQKRCSGGKGLVNELIRCDPLQIVQSYQSLLICKRMESVTHSTKTKHPTGPWLPSWWLPTTNSAVVPGKSLWIAFSCLKFQQIQWLHEDNDQPWALPKRHM